MSTRRKQYAPTEIARLAALSLAYQESRPDIVKAVVQEMRSGSGRMHYRRVARCFGIPEDEVANYTPDVALRVRNGKVQRAGLQGVESVMATVLVHIEMGVLTPGQRFPPRMEFVKTYRCAKHTHGEVVRRLTKAGVIYRPGGAGGGLRITQLD